MVGTSGDLRACRRRPPGATEDDAPVAGAVPRKSEEAGSQLAAQGVRAMVVRRLALGARRRRPRLRPALSRASDAKRRFGIRGWRQNRWPAVHRLDAAHLYRLVLEKGSAGRYHAAADEGVPFQDIGGHRPTFERADCQQVA